mgnify:CR=1 FL=1
MWRDYDLLTMILGIAGLMFAVIQYEFDKNSKHHKRSIELWPNAMDDPTN